MTLVPNHRQLSSGSKISLLLFLLTFIIGSCAKPTTIAKAEGDTIYVRRPNPLIKARKSRKKIFEPYEISLILPFNLKEYKTENISQKEAEELALPIGFYHGFRLGVDSAANFVNKCFVLNVYNAKDSATYLSRNIFKKNLFIVCPDGLFDIAGLKEQAKIHHIPVILPFSNEDIENIDYSSQITVQSGIREHVNKIFDDISNTKKPTILYLLETPDGEYPKYLQSVYQRCQAEDAKHIRLKRITSCKSIDYFRRSNLGDSIACLIIASSRKTRISTILNDLHYLTNSYDRSLSKIYGHFNWRQLELNDVAPLISQLNIKITSLNIPDAKKEKEFNRLYRKRYGVRCQVLSRIGFDVGFYFASVVGRFEDEWLSKLEEVYYDGLSMDYSFDKHIQYGFFNQEVHFLKYNHKGKLYPIE